MKRKQITTLYLAQLFKSDYPQANLRAWCRKQHEAQQYIDHHLASGDYVRGTVTPVRGYLDRGCFYPLAQSFSAWA